MGSQNVPGPEFLGFERAKIRPFEFKRRGNLREHKDEVEARYKAECGVDLRGSRQL